jgi:Mg2+/Co2+ transporter CorB
MTPMTEAPSSLALLGAGAAILVLLLLAALLAITEPLPAGRGREGRARADRDRDQLAGGQLLGGSIAIAGAAALAAWVGGHVAGLWGALAAILLIPVLVVVLAGLLRAPEPGEATGPLAGFGGRIAAGLAPLAALLRRTRHAAPVSVEPDEPPAPDAVPEEDDRARFLDQLDLGERAVEEVMVHRRDIDMIDAEASPAEIFDQAINSTHTRLPIFHGEPENIVGVIHAKDLSRAVHRFVQEHRGGESPLEGFDILDVAMPPYFVPESTPLDEQLREFLRRRAHFALVIDEYGALQGLVTLEDILEEIVGDITDEHDRETPPGIEPQPDGSVEVDGGVPIRDLNRVRDWDLPDEEANTIAGLVIHEAQTIPEPGQAFTFYGYRFEILRKSRNKITALRIRPIATATMSAKSSHESDAMDAG